jgi:hypothetical protein
VTAGITCPRCGRTSYNPNDVAQGYCGACHDWTTPPSGAWGDCREEVALTDDQLERVTREEGAASEFEPTYQCDLWGKHSPHVSFVNDYGPSKGVWIRWVARRPGKLVWGVPCPVGNGQEGDDDTPFCALWQGHIGRHYMVKPEERSWVKVRLWLRQGDQHWVWDETRLDYQAELAGGLQRVAKMHANVLNIIAKGTYRPGMEPTYTVEFEFPDGEHVRFGDDRDAMVDPEALDPGRLAEKFEELFRRRHPG